MTATGFFNISADEYHNDPCAVPSLSSSLAKVLLNETPLHAWLKHPKLNPNYETQDESKFDLGSVTHELILGKGGGFEILDFADYRKKEAQEARKTAHDAGKTPILAEQFERAQEMAAAVIARVRQIPTLETAFLKDAGMAETVCVWNDPGKAVCRSMIDWWHGDETTIIDVKSCSTGLSDSALARTITNLGYDLSAGFYLRGIHTLRPDLAGRMRFIWAFCETEAPFEVRCIQADAVALAMGDRKSAVAIEIWRDCMERNEWPGYPATIDTVTYPTFAESSWIARELEDPAAMRAVFSGRVIESKPKELTYGG